MSEKVVGLKDDVHEWLMMQRATSHKPVKKIVDEIIREKMVM